MAKHEANRLLKRPPANDVQLAEWGWSAQAVDGMTATISIPASGVYTISVWMREDGMRLDREYDPFGGIRTLLAGMGSSAYGFAVEEQDATTEQLYLRARTYSPRTGRFLQQDSVIGAANQPRTLHRYAYSFNNPVNYTDPSGNMPNSGRNNAPRSYQKTFDTIRQEGRLAAEAWRSAQAQRSNKWQTFSDETGRLASRGSRPFLCGAGSLFADHLPDLITTINPFYSATAMSKHLLARLEETGTLDQMLALADNVSQEARRFMQQSGLTGVLVQAKVAAMKVRDWTKMQWQSADAWGEAALGSEDWELVKAVALTLGVATLTVATGGVAGLAVMGGGILVGGGLSVTKQLLTTGKVDLRETLLFSLYGASAAGLLATGSALGGPLAGARQKAILAQFSGGFFNVGVNYLTNNYESAYTPGHLLTDFGIGVAFTAGASAIAEKIFIASLIDDSISVGRRAGSLTGRLGASGLLNIGEDAATRISRYELDGTGIQYDSQDARRAFSFGVIGRGIGEFAGLGSRRIYKTRVDEAIEESFAPIISKIDDEISDAVRTVRKTNEGLGLARHIRRFDSIAPNPQFKNPRVVEIFLFVEDLLRKTKSQAVNQTSNLLSERSFIRGSQKGIVNNIAVHNPLPSDLSRLELVGSNILGDSEFLPSLFDNIGQTGHNLQEENEQYSTLLFGLP